MILNVILDLFASFYKSSLGTDPMSFGDPKNVLFSQAAEEANVMLVLKITRRHRDTKFLDLSVALCLCVDFD